MVTHNRDLTARMNWFDRQFLRAQDFADEQDYQLDRRHRHNRLLHTAGVAEGLAVTGELQATTIAISRGMAIDTAGREVVLLDSMTYALPSGFASVTKAEVYLVYEEQAVSPSTDPGVTDQPTRTREAARIELRQTQPAQDPVPTSQTPGPVGSSPVPGVLIATLVLAGGKLAEVPSTTGRRVAGALLEQAALPELLLKVPSKGQPDWPRIFGEAVRTVGVDGHVHLSSGSDLVLGGATSARLHFDEATKMLTLASPSVVAIAAQTSTDALVVSGPARLGSAAVTGAITPSVGDDAAHGIQFPANPGGGAGDEAYIRYAARSGERTALIIGIRNDMDDRISFVQGDRERLALTGGMAHMGTLDGSNAAPSQVVGAVGFWGNTQQHGQMSFRVGRGFEFVDASASAPTLDYAANSRPYADIWGKDAHVSGMALPGGATVSASGRLHITGDELLYVLNKSGAVIGKEWGGNGNLAVQGDVSVGGRMNVAGPVQALNFGHPGFPPDSGYPTGWGGGVHTWDIYAEGTIGCGTGGVVSAGIDNTGTVFGKVKRFIIDHPLDPEEKSLVHAAIEGPEYAVYYRGEGVLAKGAAEVALPDYFEELTRKSGRTVLLTPVFEHDEPVQALAASPVKDGRFRVRTLDGSSASHGFYWEVRAVRADIETLVPEVDKEDAFRAPSPMAELAPQADMVVANPPKASEAPVPVGPDVPPKTRSKAAAKSAVKTTAPRRRARKA